jgi:transcription initiation factor IIF auxiliary subunit
MNHQFFGGEISALTTVEQLKEEALQECSRRIEEGEIDIDREKQSKEQYHAKYR